MSGGNRVKKWFEGVGIKISLLGKDQRRRDAMEDPMVLELLEIFYNEGVCFEKYKDIPNSAYTFNELKEELSR